MFLGGAEEEVTAKELSKVKLEGMVWEKRSALAECKMVLVPSEETRGEREEKEKLKLIYLAKCQKAWGRETWILLHFLKRKQLDLAFSYHNEMRNIRDCGIRRLM